MRPILQFDCPFPESLRSRKKTSEAVKLWLDNVCMKGSLSRDFKYRVEMTFYGKWETAKGKILRRDVHNYASVLIDLLEGRLGFDDSQVWEFVQIKRHSTGREHVVVKFFPA